MSTPEQDRYRVRQARDVYEARKARYGLSDVRTVSAAVALDEAMEWASAARQARRGCFP